MFQPVMFYLSESQSDAGYPISIENPIVTQSYQYFAPRRSAATAPEHIVFILSSCRSIFELSEHRALFVRRLHSKTIFALVPLSSWLSRRAAVGHIDSISHS